MSDEKSYLDQLAEYYNQNKINRKEEEDSMNDFPKSGEYGPRQRSFTRNMLAANTNLPQDDVHEYVQNVKDDNMQHFEDMGQMGGAINMLGKAGKAIAPKLLPRVLPKIEEAVESAPRRIRDLAEEYLPKNISDKVGDIYNNIKSGQNIKRIEQASKDSERIKGLQDIANRKPTFEAEIPKDQNPFDLDIFQKNLDIEKAKEAQRLRDLGIKNNILDNPDLLEQAKEKTITSTRNR